MSNKPNVIFILIDDMGWKDLSCTGSTFYETPHIDRLAREGMSFSNAYAACPVCSPTRASIMTGKYPARLGLTHFIGSESHCKKGSEKGRVLGAPYIPYLPNLEKSLATTFLENGYATWHIGKWHLGSEAYWPEQHGFEINIGGCHAGHPPGPNHYFAPFSIPTLEQKPDDDYLTDRLGDEAAALIRQSDGPFFMNMCFYQVHTPLMAKKEKVDKYRRKVTDLGLDKIEAIVKGDYFPVEHKKNQRIQRRVVQSDPVYAAMIEHLDDNVGKILDALEAKGIAENTIIVFTSDNGGLSTSEGSPTCNAPLAEGKGWMYEGGTREPLLVRWPNVIAAGQQSDALVTSPDFYPTLLEACKIDLDPVQHCDGQSFLSVLKDVNRSYDRGSLFWHYPHYGNQGGEPGCSIRKGKWKCIEFFEGSVQLFDLSSDLSELHDLSEEHPQVKSELLNELHAWQLEVNAIVPDKNADWEPWCDKDLIATD